MKPVTEEQFEAIRGQIRNMLMEAGFSVFDAQRLFELHLVELELEMHGGSRSKAAKALIETGYRLGAVLRNEDRGLIVARSPTQ